MPFRSCRSKEGRYFITWPDSFHPGFRRGAIADKNNLRIPSRRVLLLCIYHYVYKTFSSFVFPLEAELFRLSFWTPPNSTVFPSYFFRNSFVVSFLFPQLLFSSIQNTFEPRTLSLSLSLSLPLFVSQAKKKKVSSVQKLVLKHDDRLHVRQFRPLLYNISTSDTVSYKYRTRLLYIIVVSVTITQLQRMRVTRIAMI